MARGASKVRRDDESDGFAINPLSASTGAGGQWINYVNKL